MINNDQRTYFLFLQLIILKKNEIFTITFLSGLKWMTAWRQLINKLTLYGYRIYDIPALIQTST